jgi:hypothetical protein
MQKLHSTFDGAGDFGVSGLTKSFRGGLENNCFQIEPGDLCDLFDARSKSWYRVRPRLVSDDILGLVPLQKVPQEVVELWGLRRDPGYYYSDFNRDFPCEGLHVFTTPREAEADVRAFSQHPSFDTPRLTHAKPTRGVTLHLSGIS